MSELSITIELLKVYKTYADQIVIAYDVAKVLHGIRDIKACGNEIEASVRAIFNELLAKKYNVNQGHIIDTQLQVSKQYDFIISEGIDYRSIIKTKDQTELFFYETIFCIGEIKATWDLKNFKSTIDSIKDLKTRLNRNPILNTVIFSGNSEIRLKTELTVNPIRNPIFSFAFAINADKDLRKFKNIYENHSEWKYLPNISVILNLGIFALIKKDSLKTGKLIINLYPEFVTDTSSYEWKFIACKNTGKNLAYLLFCIQEHLSTTILEKPPYLTYSNTLLDADVEDIINLDEI